MGTRLSLDRFEGRAKQLAVCSSQDMTEVILPRDLLPEGTGEGEVLTVAPRCRG